MLENQLVWWILSVLCQRPRGKIVSMNDDTCFCSRCGLLTKYWGLYSWDKTHCSLLIHLLYKLIAYRNGWLLQSTTIIFGFLEVSGLMWEIKVMSSEFFDIILCQSNYYIYLSSMLESGYSLTLVFTTQPFQVRL